MAKKDKKDKKEEIAVPKVLDAAIQAIQNEHGDGFLMNGIDGNKVVQCASVSTGCLALDVALGVGGVPKGRIIEIFGPESSGKTTLALSMVANVQREGGIAVYIDVEHALDPMWMKKIGVDLGKNKFYLAQPDTAEQALTASEQLIETGKIAIIVIDSVASLVPRAELEGEMGASHIGLQARLMSQAMRKLKGLVYRTGTIMIFINQIREKVGQMMPGQSNEVTPGGRALKFYSSVRMDIRRTGSIFIGKEASRIAVGNEVKVKVVKNKVAPPFKLANFSILFDAGISNPLSVLDLGVREGLIKKSGSFHKYGDVTLGNGRLEAAQFLAIKQDICNQIETSLRDILFNKSTNELVPDSGPDPDGTEDIEVTEHVGQSDHFAARSAEVQSE